MTETKSKTQSWTYEPYFCKTNSPFSAIHRTRRTARIARMNGEVVFEQGNVEAPDFWSDTAVNFAAQKYFIHTEAVTEDSVFAMIEGVVKTIGMAGHTFGYFRHTDERIAFENDLAYLLIHQYGAFNSPVWFNVRRWHAYKIPGGPGNWAVNENGKVEQVDAAYKRPQCSACFIHTIDDSLVEPGGIADFVKAEMRLFKFGSGSGANFSKLREKDAKLSPGGRASGLMSFLPVFDRAAGSVASGGTSRRAAKMVVLDVDHPEIEEFIDWKVKEEMKARDLIAAGWSGDMEGEAYKTVDGQNANNSVRVSDKFMRAVADDEEFNLTSRVDGRVVKTVRARALWDQLAYAAWFCADPGIHFDDTFNAWNPTPNGGRINATNPCSEYAHLDNSACNLASLNLVKFLDQGYFDHDKLQAAARVFIIAQDILVSFSSYPTKAIAEGANKYRQLGLGYANLGALLAIRGMAYDSDPGREFARNITASMMGAAFLTSAQLAARMGPFAGYEADKEGVWHVFQKHVKHLHGSGHLTWELAADLIQTYGLRNAQLTLLAPTGTISFLMDCTTTGIEPLLSHVQYKQLAGGGDVRIASPLTRMTLEALRYAPEAVTSILQHLEQTGSVEGAPGLDPKHLPAFDTALAPTPGGRVISANGHLAMMAAVQPFLSGAISKTVNLPTDTTAAQIGDYYLQAWSSGIKALAVYRDGCKNSQPVTTKAKGVEETKAEGPSLVEALEEFSVERPLREGQRHKLPTVRRGLTWAVNLDGHKIYIRSGEFEDGALGEVFVDLAKQGSTLGGLVGMWAKALSLGLQYGVPLATFVEAFTFTRFEPSGTVQKHDTIRRSTSIVDLVMRVLAVHYLKRTDLQHVQGEVEEVAPQPAQVITLLSPNVAAPMRTNDSPACRVCGTIMVRTGACYTCPSCGASGGCG